MDINTLCLSGGSISGISTISFLYKLSKMNFINEKKINRFIGCSAGSIICFLCALGYTFKEISDFILNFDFKILEQEFDLDRLINKLGTFTTSRIIVALQTFLYEKFKVKDITFKELYDRTNNFFGLTVTNYTKKCEDFFSTESTPNMSVLDAIRISISVPLIFVPIKLNDCLYVDGGLTNNFPLNYCDSNKTLGIVITSKTNSDPNNLIEYLKGVAEVLHRNICLKYCSNFKYIIEVETTMGLAQVTSTYDEKIELWDLGVNKAIEFSNNNVDFIVNKLLCELINKLESNIVI